MNVRAVALLTWHSQLLTVLRQLSSWLCTEGNPARSLVLSLYCSEHGSLFDFYTTTAITSIKPYIWLLLQPVGNLGTRRIFDISLPISDIGYILMRQRNV
eukprot:scaffold266832_cov27-Prasinocladus_malaysianus.AAC.2